jgi:hypothetical protein
MRTFSRWALALMISLLALFAVLLLADRAKAQTLQCGPIDQVIELLVRKYGEELFGTGQGPNGTRLFVFAHPDGATWTVFATMPDGQACIIASGASWHAAAPTPPGSET